MYKYLPTINPEKTGKRIEELRKLQKLSRREVQEYFGFTTDQAIYKWEKGKSIPSADNLLALSWLLNTSIEEILRTDREREEEAERSPLPVLAA